MRWPRLPAIRVSTHMSARGAAHLATAALLCLCACAAPAQPDPLAQQQRANQRLEAWLDQARRSGDFQAGRDTLIQLEADYAQSNAALAQRGLTKELALGQIKQGSVWRIQGQLARATALYTQAAATARRGGHVAMEADALGWLAFALLSDGQLGQALTEVTRALGLAETAGQADVLARVLDVYASVQIAQRDLPGAAATLEREVVLAATLPAGLDATMASFYALLNRSDVYLKIAERCDFQRDFDPCLQAAERARTDMLAVQAIARRQGFAGLEQQAAGMLRGIEARRELILARRGHEQGLQRAAIFHPRRAEDVLVSAQFVAPPGPLPAPLLALLQEQKRVEQAAGPAARGLESVTLYTEGLLAEMQGRSEAALAGYQQAVAALERDRRSLRDERSRGSFMENRITVYYAAVLQLLQQQRHAEAFEMLERSRSRALADLLASRRPELQGGEEQALMAQAATLRARIADAQGRLFEAGGGAVASSNAAARIEADENSYRALLESMATRAPRLAALVESRPATLAALQASMRAEGYETLQYLVTESAVILWHITADSVFVRNVFLPRSELMRKVAALGASLRNPALPFDEATAGELFLYLVQPALARVRSERLVILPHESLAQLPFQALRNPANGAFLGDRLQISYAPSATVLLSLRRTAALGDARVLALADPAVQGAAQEVQAIARLFGGRAQTAADVLPLKADVRARVAGFDVVHLAVHGSFDAGEPMLSHLKFRPAGADDGRLTAAEMFGLPLAGNRLVVLSACDTGRTETTHANETLGMARGLLFAGAGALLLSSWPVQSAATSLWMQAFYEAARSQPLAQAARGAALRVKNAPATAHPFYWAGFSLLGR